MRLIGYIADRLTAQAGPETSKLAMVAVYPRSEEAERLVVEDGLEAPDLHCTLVFLGDAEDADAEVIGEALALVASELAPLEGVVGGWGAFSENPDGVPLLALPDVQGLTMLRERVVDELGERGVRSPSEHGFLPHMTLTYLSEDDEEGLEVAAERMGQPLHFDAVSVVIGDERTDYELSGARVAAAFASFATPEDLAAATERARERLEESVPELAGSYAEVLRAASRRISRSFRAQAVPLTAAGDGFLAQLSKRMAVPVHLTAAAFVPPDEDEVIGADRLAEEMTETAGEAQALAAEQVAEALRAEGIAFDVDAVFTEELIAAIGERATFAANEQLRDVYREVIADAAEKGWSVPTAAEEIVKRIDGQADWRARALARTDLNGLANGGSVHVAQQTIGKEQQVYKTWLATEDELTRDSHIDANGQSVAVNEVFNVGGTALRYPGDPFGPPEEVMNCRCTITYSSEPGGRVVEDPDARPEGALHEAIADLSVSNETLEIAESEWTDDEILANHYEELFDSPGQFRPADSPETRAAIERWTTAMEDKMRAELSSASIKVRAPGDVADQIISDGRFKSQFETQTSMGLLNDDFRAGAENNLFGYERGETPAESRPIYGYLGGITRETAYVGNYGEVAFVLKDGVRARATWTGVDSLGGFVAPSSFQRPSILSLYRYRVQGADISLRTPMSEWIGNYYMEAQIHGGLSLDDVASIEVYYDDDFEGADDALEVALETVRRLQAQVSVPVRAVPYQPSLRSSAEQLSSLGEDLVGVEAVGDVVPVAASEHGLQGELVADRGEPAIEHAHLGVLGESPAAAGEQHEVRLSSHGDDLHARIVHTRADPATTGARPDGALPSASMPNEEESMSTTASPTRRGQLANGNGEVVMRDPIAWEATLCIEGAPTEDGRLLERGAISWRDLPLTLMGMIETSEWGHEGAQVAGRMDEVFRVADDIASEGQLTSDFGIDTLAPLIADRTVRGVSVDLAVLDYEYRDRETGETLTDDDLFIYWLEGKENQILFTVLDGIIVGATVCPMPAIANAEIALAASAGLDAQQRSIIASALEGTKVSPLDVPIIRVFTPFDRRSSRQALFASSARFDTDAPSRDAFFLTEFPGKTPLTITDDGRVFGHIATWDTCHVGIAGVCTTAPRSGTNPAYAYFHTGQWPTAEGELVDVGKLMLGTGHASLAASRMEATKHYDKPDMVGAYVRAYDGEHGIWVSGVVRPELSADGMRELRANPPSGDWRSVAGRLELIAVCAVAVPGFPVPQAQANIVAAAGDLDISALVASSGVIVPTSEVKTALIAAGCDCEELVTDDEALDDLAELSID